MVRQVPGPQDLTSTSSPTFSISSDDTTLCLPLCYNSDPYSPFHMASQENEGLKTFTTYCDKPYDRHHYVINFKDGKTLTVDEYELPEYSGISPKMK